MAAAASIPVIDISGEGANQVEVARALVDAAASHGFVYIKNTGKEIPVSQIDNAFDVSKTIFGSDLEEKQKCKINQQNEGWVGMNVETLGLKSQRIGDFKEAFNFGAFEDGKATQSIPSTIESRQAEISDFRQACHNLCCKIFALLGLGLEVTPPDFFTAAHATSQPSTLRLLYYPPPSGTAAEENDFRAGAHSDYGSITLLFRLKGQAGLEILPASGVWAPVPVCPPGTENDPAPPILVNIGDLLSYWTRGLLRSTVHRVSFPDSGAATVDGESTTEPRYSIAFFCHPMNETKLTAVPSERVREYKGTGDTNAGNPFAEHSEVLTADEHLQMRLRASYTHYEEKEAKA